ncbi:hypothetical protein PGB90_000925 [Kerria lacca]
MKGSGSGREGIAVSSFYSFCLFRAMNCICVYVLHCVTLLVWCSVSVSNMYSVRIVYLGTVYRSRPIVGAFGRGKNLRGPCANQHYSTQFYHS